LWSNQSNHTHHTWVNKNLALQPTGDDNVRAQAAAAANEEETP
jgi:hypothetical protein